MIILILSKNFLFLLNISALNKIMMKSVNCRLICVLDICPSISILIRRFVDKYEKKTNKIYFNCSVSLSNGILTFVGYLMPKPSLKGCSGTI